MHSFRQVGDLGFVVFASLADDDYLAEWHHHVWQYCVAALIFSLIVIWFEMLQRRSENALIESYAKSQLACVFHGNWTLSPRQTGQSERSDAGVVFYS